ncbi:MAG: hypothetical protein ACR2PH_02010, partial [Desulfobulbia bacterium]
MAVGNIRIPPDSTGAKVGVVERAQLQYDTLTGSFAVGDVVTGATSSANGTITGIDTFGYAAASGLLYLENTTGTFVDDENIQIAAVTQAVVDLTNQVYETVKFQQNIVSDPETPTYMQRVSEFGEARVSFADGAPTFGAFGSLSVGESQVIKDYRFAYEGCDAEFYDTTASGGTLTWEANASVMLFSTTTTSGSESTRTSHFYHPYAPGVGHRVEMTVQIGDEGKTNVRRRWGYFDDNNGIFFELNGTSLRLGLRSNATGSVVNGYVDQADWNNDPADGTGRIDFDLDVSKANIYFIDLQWLGAGRVRLGAILPSGEQRVFHVYENANITNLPYMRTATLPLRIEQTNTGTAASSSEMRWACASVKHTSKVLITGDAFSD